MSLQPPKLFYNKFVYFTKAPNCLTVPNPQKSKEDFRKCLMYGDVCDDCMILGSKPSIS